MLDVAMGESAACSATYATRGERRRKTAAERRQQRQRAEARFAGKLARTIASLAHRGSHPVGRLTDLASKLAAPPAYEVPLPNWGTAPMEGTQEGKEQIELPVGKEHIERPAAKEFSFNPSASTFTPASDLHPLGAGQQVSSSSPAAIMERRLRQEDMARISRAEAPRHSGVSMASGHGTAPTEGIQERIELIVKGQFGDVSFTIKKFTPLRKVQDSYCNNLGIQTSDVRFLSCPSKGPWRTRIEPNDTAETLGLNDGDIIAAHAAEGRAGADALPVGHAGESRAHADDDRAGASTAPGVVKRRLNGKQPLRD
jgi:hypothetical protein